MRPGRRRVRTRLYLAARHLVERIAGATVVDNALTPLEHAARGWRAVDASGPPVGMAPGHWTPNPGDWFPKVAPLCGSLHQERKRCGTPGCRCAQGRLHGPYWVRRWWERGRLRRAYVPRDHVDEVRAAIAEWRRLHPVPWAVRHALAELRRLEQEVRPCPP